MCAILNDALFIIIISQIFFWRQLSELPSRDFIETAISYMSTSIFECSAIVVNEITISILLLLLLST